MLQSKDFQRILTHCLNELPESLARVFVLREVNELTTNEICELLDITPGNLWVMLHRAGLRLQHLLGLHWFNAVESKPRASLWALGNTLTQRTS